MEKDKTHSASSIKERGEVGEKIKNLRMKDIAEMLKGKQQRWNLEIVFAEGGGS